MIINLPGMGILSFCNTLYVLVLVVRDAPIYQYCSFFNNVHKARGGAIPTLQKLLNS